SVFFFNDTATTEIYPLSLHDALPLFSGRGQCCATTCSLSASPVPPPQKKRRSEEHTSELQSLAYLVCPLLSEKTKSRASAPYKHPTSTSLQNYASDVHSH